MIPLGHLNKGQKRQEMEIRQLVSPSESIRGCLFSENVLAGARSVSQDHKTVY